MIAVSIFIKQNGNRITISSLAADGIVSKSIEKMLCEQAEHVIKYVDAGHECADIIAQQQKKEDLAAKQNSGKSSRGRE